MSSLLYSAAKDPYHTIFRMLCILKSHAGDKPIQGGASLRLEVERMQIYDFYVCFPWTLASFTGSKEISNFIKTQNLIKKQYTNNEYEKIPSSEGMFFNMNSIQRFSIETLVVKNIIDHKGNDSGYITFKPEELSEELTTCVSNYIEEHENLFDFLVNYLGQIPLNGRQGLKHRSKLKEYRYDII